MNATGPGASGGPKPALMSALTTEQYTLQSARAATMVEANGRSALFPLVGQRRHRSVGAGGSIGAVMSSDAPLDQMGDTFMTFALSILPALLVLGLTSYSRLADLAVHDAYYARAIGRIPVFYLTNEPAAQRYWLQPPDTTPTR
jgi:hypothetical protein